LEILLVLNFSTLSQAVLLKTISVPKAETCEKAEKLLYLQGLSSSVKLTEHQKPASAKCQITVFGIRRVTNFVRSRIRFVEAMACPRPMSAANKRLYKIATKKHERHEIL
jgi:hypothetical protein